MISFTFLSDRYLLLNGDNNLDMVVLDLSSLDGQDIGVPLSRVDCICRFLFPAVKETEQGMWLSFCASPQDTGDSCYHTESNTLFDQSKPTFFHTDPSEKTIIAVPRLALCGPFRVKFCVFAISPSTLLSFITQLQTEGVPPNYVVEWGKWGPHGTRCFKSSSTSSLQACYGTRFVKRFYDQEGGVLGFDIFDMNQWPIRRALCGGEREPGMGNTAPGLSSGWKTITEPSELEADGDSPFVEGVVTSLPYRHKRMPIQTWDINDEGYPVVMLTEDAMFITWKVSRYDTNPQIVRILFDFIYVVPLTSLFVVTGSNRCHLYIGGSIVSPREGTCHKLPYVSRRASKDIFSLGVLTRCCQSIRITRIGPLSFDYSGPYHNF